MNQLCICTIKTPNEELKCYYHKHFVLFPFFLMFLESTSAEY